MAAVVVVYAGLIAATIGLLSLIRPIRLAGVRTRRRAAAIAGVGMLLFLIGATLPARENVSSTRATLLDDFIPVYQFNEVHSIHVHAPPSAVFQAAQQVTAREVRLFRILTWIRSPHFGRAPESVLAPPPDQPILDVATRSGFLLLGESAAREIVFGTIGFGAGLGVSKPTPQDFKDFKRPGYAKIAMNFTVTPEPNGWSTLRTETRVYGTDAGASKRFSAYWRLIYPGSSLIRVMWLRAIRTRAER